MICFAPGMGGAYVFLVAAGDRVAAAPRPGRARARARVGARADASGSSRRRPPPGSCSPSSTRRTRSSSGSRSSASWSCARSGSEQDLRPGALALGALVVPAALFMLWLRPIVNDTRSVSPDADELQRAFDQYGSQLVIRSDTSYNLAPEVFTRSGAVAIAALLLIPLAGFAARRRWAAYVVGGSLAVFAVMLVPFLFTSLADLVSISQARRAAGFLPFAFAFAGGHGSARAPRRAAPAPARARRRDVPADRLPGRLRVRPARTRRRPGSRGSRSSERVAALVVGLRAAGGLRSRPEPRSPPRRS